MKGFLVALVLFVGLIGSAVLQGINSYNTGVDFETQIDKTYQNNQNILGQYSLKVKEAAKVSDKYADSLTKLMEQTLSARYGEEGSGAMMQWIQEQNPALDPQLYVKLQQIIEAGRNEFQLNQTTLLDQCRIYKLQIGYLWSGFWLKLVGYPKEGLMKKCTPIQSDYSKQAFDTGIEKGVDF